MDWLSAQTEAIAREVVTLLSGPETFVQIGIVCLALLLAWAAAAILSSRATIFRERPAPGVLFDLRTTVHNARGLLLPAMAVAILAIASPLSVSLAGEDWLVSAVQGIALIVLFYGVAGQFIHSAVIVFILKWIGIPIALLYVIGWLDDVVVHLDSIAIDIGNFNVTLYGVLRTFLFGVILFWLGRASNATGQRLIRTQEVLDAGTREVVAKLFEIGLYALIVLVFMNVMGIDLTALAVFGGALGVGLGFGLQQIASNFISGIIILLDRSIAVGDYIELEDGRCGRLRELTMRSATLETFDGKDIMVPNERFITASFVNWTHNNKKQRYPLTFQVAYDTDLKKLFEIVRQTVAGHPKVLSGPDLPIAERPDAEIESFGDSGINILVEFWMEDIDDGENRVGADLLLMIWTALKANDIAIPFPQREVKILDGVGAR